MTEQKFKLAFFRGTEEQLSNLVIMGDGPEPDLVVDLPEKYYDHIYNTLFEMAAKEKREAAPK